MTDLANRFRKAALLKNSERSMNEGERRGQDHEQWRLVPLIELAAKAIEALEFYASKNDCWFGYCEELSDDLKALNNDAGERATKTLAEIRSAMEGE